MLTTDPWARVFPYSLDPVVPEEKDFDAMFRWLRQRYGDPAMHPDRAEGLLWAATIVGIRFRNADDAFEFKMRWC